MAALSGLNSLAGINALSVDSPDATAEERNGGPADPYHGQWGEQAEPYPWESSLTMSGSHGPYGPENQLLGDEFWMMEPGGSASEDPDYDYNTPFRSKSHASVHNVTTSGPVPSQSEAVHEQIAQVGNHGSNLGSSANMQRWDEPLNDQWQEIWEIDEGNSDTPKVPGSIGYQANGWGVNDRPTNAYAKTNLYGYGSIHKHRRFAVGSIPGNYMWLKPAGRPMFKTLPGTARPAIGGNSPFAGNDLGQAFAYDNGAILQDVPQAYVPPPTPNVSTSGLMAPPTDSMYGTDAIEIW